MTITITRFTVIAVLFLATGTAHAKK